MGFPKRKKVEFYKYKLVMVEVRKILQFIVALKMDFQKMQN